MRKDTYDLVCPASVAAGTARTVREYVNGIVNFYGAGTWTAQLQGKITGPAGGGDWVNIGAAAAGGAPALVVVPDAVTDLRVNVIAYTSGTPGAVFGGLQTRHEV